MSGENQTETGNIKSKKGDVTSPNNRDQQVSQPSSAAIPNQRSAATVTSNNNSNNNSSFNQGRSRFNNQGERQQNQSSTSGASRRSTNYAGGGSSGRPHGRNSNRHSLDSNSQSAQNSVSHTAPTNPSNSSNNRSSFNPRNRYDQGHHFSGNPRHHDNRNNQTQNNHPPSIAGNQSSLNRIFNDFSQFPSLNDPNVTTGGTLRSTSDTSHPTTSSMISGGTLSGVSNNHRRGSTGGTATINTAATTASSGNNHLLFADPTTPSLSNQQSAYSGHSPNNSGNNRHHHGNRRSGGYNRGSNRDHQGGSNYGRGGGSNSHHRSSNPSHQPHYAGTTVSATSPSSGGGPSINNNTQRNQHEVQHHQGATIVTPTNIVPNSRPRGNRRGTNSSNTGGGYDHSRRVSNRDYNQLPSSMNGVRIGNHPINSQIPATFFNGNRGYHPPPMMTTGIPPAVALHPSYLPVSAADNTNAMAVNANVGVLQDTSLTVTEEERAADLEESMLYKNLTTDSKIPLLDQAMYQIEFYFSVCNLRTDNYLRGKMDEEGYVLASIILGFNRLTRYNLTISDLIKMMGKTTKLEHKVVDGVTYIRRKEDPLKWTNEGLRNQAKLKASAEVQFNSTSSTIINAGGNLTHGIPAHHIPPTLGYNFPYSRFGPPVVHPQTAAPYIHQFAPPQFPINYMYAYEDTNGNVYYDPSGAQTFDYGSIPYNETLHNPPNSLASSIGSYSQHSDVLTNNGSAGTADNGSYSNPSVVMNTNASDGSVASNLNQPSAHSPTDDHVTQRQSSNPAFHESSNDPHDASAVVSPPAEPSKLNTLDCDHPTPSSVVESSPSDSSEGDSTFQLTSNEYNRLVEQVVDQRKNRASSGKVVCTKEQKKLYLHWTQNLVLNFEQKKYDLFKVYAVDDAKLRLTEGLTLLYQFYERFLHRFPLTSTVSSGSADADISAKAVTTENDSLTSRRLSLQIFDDFQQISYDDYVHNENVSGLKKLLRFKTQFTNPSRQPPRFKGFVQEMILSLGLEDSYDNPILNGDRHSPSSSVEGGCVVDSAPSGSVVTDRTGSPSFSKSSDKQSNLSTHH